jgi:integrase
VLVSVLAYAGLRPWSEAVTLAWDDVRERTLRVYASKTRSGRAWTEHDVRNRHPRVWKPAIKACELDPATVPDDLRHSFASLLIHEKRLSIVEIAEQMGHALTMTSDTDDHVT